MNRDHVRWGKAPFGLKKNAVWLRKNAAAEACFFRWHHAVHTPSGAALMIIE